jgi:hypothetical protein
MLTLWGYCGGGNLAWRIFVLGIPFITVGCKNCRFVAVNLKMSMVNQNVLAMQMIAALKSPRPIVRVTLFTDSVVRLYRISQLGL